MSKKRSNIGSVIATIIVLLLVGGAIGALIYLTNGFTEPPTSFYAVVDGNRIMSLSKGYDLSRKNLSVDVRYIFDEMTDVEQNYSVKIVPHIIDEERDFEYTIDGKTYKYSEEKELSEGFDIKKEGMSFTVIPKGCLGDILRIIHSGTEISDCMGKAYEDMYELQIISYNEKFTVKILFTVSDFIKIESLTLDRAEVIF